MSTKHTPEWEVIYDNGDNAEQGQWYKVGPAKIEFPYNRSDEVAAEARATAIIISQVNPMLELLQKFVDVQFAYQFHALQKEAKSLINKATQP